MAAIVTIRNAKGDLEVHIAGCADVAKTLKQTREDAPVAYEGINLLSAVREADADWADAFGNEVYSEDQANGQSWTISHMAWAPCFAKASKEARIVYGVRGEPDYAKTSEEPTATVPTGTAAAKAILGIGTCECGCGGSPKGKRSRFLPGHDARMHGKTK